MNGMSDVEACRYVGLDASITYADMQEVISDNWRVSITKQYIKEGNQITHYVVETPQGHLTYIQGANEMTTWMMEHLIKADEDIYLIKKYRPVPKLNKTGLQKLYDNLGEDGIVRTFIYGYQGGCWQDACELYGAEKMIYATFDKPNWVHELLNILLEKKLQYINESLSGAKVDLVETGGGAASNNLISPDIHEEFCMPYDRKMHDALHAIGHKSTYHTCGGMTKILDLIIQNGCDASETLSPVGMGGDIVDPIPVVQKFQGKVAMIGGMDQSNILTSGTPLQIQNEVKRLFEGFGMQGGYIMSASDHFFHTPVENLIAFANTGKECRY